MNETFDDFLQTQFIESHPHVYKDDLPDAYGDWELDQDELIGYAEEYHKKEVVKIMAKLDNLIAELKK